MGFVRLCLSAVSRFGCPLPESEDSFGQTLPRAWSRSAFVVSHHLDGLLHPGAVGLLHPTTGHEVRRVSDLQRQRTRKHPAPCTSFPRRGSPFEEFPSSAAVPRHRGLLPSCRFHSLHHHFGSTGRPASPACPLMQAPRPPAPVAWLGVPHPPPKWRARRPRPFCAEALRAWLTRSTPDQSLMSELTNAALAAVSRLERACSLLPRGCGRHLRVRLTRRCASRARASLLEAPDGRGHLASPRCEVPRCCRAPSCRGRLSPDCFAPDHCPRAVPLDSPKRSAWLARPEGLAWVEHLRALDDVHTPRGVLRSLRRSCCAEAPAGAGAGLAWPIRHPLLERRARHACPGVADFKALLRRRVRCAPLLFPASTHPILPWASNSPPRSSSSRSSRHPGSEEPRLPTPKRLVPVGWPE
jgi:hypothetical protein